MNACRKCGSTETRVVEIVKNDEVVAEGELCDGCFGKALDGAAKLRRQFEMLLANGVSRERANEIMIARIQRMK